MERKGRRESKNDSSDFSHFIAKFIQEKENMKHSELSIQNIYKESNVEKRRVHDFLGVLEASGITIKVSHNILSWRGFNFYKNGLFDIARRFEEIALDNENKEVLMLHPSPSVFDLTTHFLGYFTYLGVKVLNIQDCAIALSHDVSKTPVIVRRLYLVAFILDHIGIIQRTNKIKEYMLIYNDDISAPATDAIKELRKEGKYPPASIFSQLSQVTPKFMDSLFQARRVQVFSFIDYKSKLAAMEKNKCYSDDWFIM